MSYRTILVELQAERPVEIRLKTARTLAHRFEALLIGMHVVPEPFVPTFWEGGGAVYIAPEIIQAQQRANQEAKKHVRAIYDRLCAHPDLVWQEAEGDPGRLLVEAAHGSDLLITTRDEDRVDELVERLIMEAGVPVLVLPPSCPEDIGHTVLVGWNGSREASRALHGALPFLRTAKKVVVCAIGERAAAGLGNVGRMLKRHDVTIRTETVQGEDQDAGEILLAQAKAHGADLLVMGAYGHMRLRELIFGGATRHILCTAPLPVLLGG